MTAVTFSGFCTMSLPYLGCCLQNAITFFLFSSCRDWKSMLDKSLFHFVCFQNNFCLCLFPTIFTSFFQKTDSFLPKIAYISGKQTKKILFKKMKSLNILNDFPFAGCAKSSKFERVMIVQTHAHEEGNGRFFKKYSNLV